MQKPLGELPFALERDIVIRAPRKVVFRYFTDSERFAAWWGAGSSIEAQPGGAMRIVYPNGATASGEVVELQEDERIVFTFGYDGPGKPIEPGASRVTITLAEHPQGTHLSLRHDVADEKVGKMHVRGWRFQLSAFANVAAREICPDANELTDAWYAAWSEADAKKQRAAFDAITAKDVRFRDPYSCIEGLDELLVHIVAGRAHLPGASISRSGEANACQGTAMSPWIVRAADQRMVAHGFNVFDLAPDGRIQGVVGLWFGEP